VARKLLVGREAEVVDAYKKGETIEQIAERYGCSIRPVRDVLKADGVAFRSVGRRSAVRKREARIVQLYQSGSTLQEIADEYGATPRTVRKILVEHDVTIRPTGRVAAGKRGTGPTPPATASSR
jgi:DNA-binding CsgD family transcriptional regulator